MKASRIWRPLLAINLLVFLTGANWIISDKEDHLGTGRLVLLAVTQYDPRSLMQGDYMALAYPICQEIDAQVGADARGDGQVVLGIDDDDVGHFRRLHAGQPLAADEILLRYRIRWGRATKVRVAAEEFFFQEGLAEEFARARYAELRVTAAGRTLLVALRDSERRRLGEKSE
jgi:uncharacterized membrane-anchored protein